MTAARRNFGGGIINTNPLFVSESEPYDVHLQSTMGRYSNGVWVVDAVMSPCIDAGDSSPYSNEPEPNGAIINMGRYGNTAEASKSLAIRITNDGGVSNLADSSTVVNGYLDYGADPLNYIWIYWGPTDGVTNKNAWTNCVPMNGHTTGSTVLNQCFRPDFRFRILVQMLRQ